MRLSRFILTFCSASLFALFMNYQVYGELFSQGTWDRMGYALGSILVLSWLVSSPRRGPFWKQIKMVAGWGAFLILIIGLYSFRGELALVKDRIIAAILPQSGFETEPGTLSFYRSSNGHFHVEALVNGKKVRFLVDTGASDVVLAPHLANSLGFNLQPADYTKVYHTANGKGRGAPVTLSRFQLGGLVLNDLPASFNGAPMKTSLLGMRFFNRLKSYQVKGEILTLHFQTHLK